MDLTVYSECSDLKEVRKVCSGLCVIKKVCICDRKHHVLVGVGTRKVCLG
jgi:hypothetical protein